MQYPKLAEEHVSEFGAYCVEQWLTGRHPQTAREFLAIDYLRSFANCTRNGRVRFHGSSRGRVSLGPKADVELGLGKNSFELGRFIESSALRDPRLSQRERIVLILSYEWGFSLKEIGDVLAVSESRVSQVLSTAMSDQKERIQKDSAPPNQRDLERKKQATISRKVQAEFSLDEKTERVLEKIRREAVNPMVQRAEPPVSEAILEAFAVNAF